MKAARRLLPRPWRDPRLLLGIMLVLLATVVGAKLYAARDDTVAYWSLDSAVLAGDPVTRDDLAIVRVRLAGPAAARYLPASEEFPAALAELVWARDISGGALVEKSAFARAAGAHTVELPLNVAAGSFPANLGRGDHVDVWVGPEPGQPSAADASQVLHDVRVESAGGSEDVLGGSPSRTVLVGVEDRELTGGIMREISTQHVTLVRLR